MDEVLARGGLDLEDEGFESGRVASKRKEGGLGWRDRSLGNGSGGTGRRLRLGIW